MIAYPYGALATGIAFVLGAIALIIRHYLLSKSENYPSAPKFLLAAEWLYGMFIFFGGLYFISVYIFGKPNSVPPQPTDFEQAIAIVIAIRETILCINIVRQRLTKGNWAKAKAYLLGLINLKDIK